MNTIFLFFVWKNKKKKKNLISKEKFIFTKKLFLFLFIKKSRSTNIKKFNISFFKKGLQIFFIKLEIRDEIKPLSNHSNKQMFKSVESLKVL
jgi:hypothetical protein